MRVLFIVNALDDLQPAMTTTMLIAGAADRSHEVYVAGVDQLSLATDDRLLAAATRALAGSGPRQLCDRLRAERSGVVDLESVDAVLLRTNPARDRRGAHQVSLSIARMARERGVVVLNDPEGLRRASNKLYLSVVPRPFRPATMVSRDRAALRSFVESAAGRCVLKPLAGTRGVDVFFVEAGDPNLMQIVDVVTRSGYAMAQQFVAEATDGDARVVVLEGEVLAVEGVPLVIRRIPATGDLRSNIHAGGTTAPGELTEPMRDAVAAVGPRLRRDGIFLAGLDFIGGRVIEINVNATGGFFDAERLYAKGYVAAVLAAVERRVATARARGEDR